MKLITTLLLLFPGLVYAQWSNESELGIIVVDGNSESKTTNFKQTTNFKRDKDQGTGKARYTEAESNGVASAESWMVGARYDREIAEKTGAYLSHDTESDRFAGYLQRDTTGLGLTRQLIDAEKLKWSGEVGYSHLETDFANSDQTGGVDGARVFTKVNGEVKEGVTGQFYIEYLHYFDDSDPNTTSEDDNYLVNAEPSLSVLLNNTFSLKLAYLVKYQNQLPAGITERTDTTYSTTLVAKF